jgi:hypothetical protein
MPALGLILCSVKKKKKKEKERRRINPKCGLPDVLISRSLFPLKK